MSNRRGAGPGLTVAALLALTACASTPPPAAQHPAAAAPSLAKAPPAPAGPPEGPPVTLLPASTARPFELASISVTSADRLLTSGATLAARAVPLPIDPAGLRDMLLSQAGLAPEVATNLDLTSPSSASIVATGHGADTGVVIAVAARGPAEAERVISALGSAVMKRGAVVLVDNGAGGRGWVFRAGNIVVLSDKLDALARGAMLALEARHAAPEDVNAVLFPDAIARANGTDVRSAVTFAIEALRAAQAASHAGQEGEAEDQAKKPPHGASEHSMEMAAEILGMIADVETAELGMGVDPARGLLLRARLHPRAGSALAGVAREAHAYELDRAVLEGAGGVPALVAASSYGPFMRGAMARQRERLAADAAAAPKDKALAQALSFFDAMMAALAGQTSVACAVSPDVPHFSAEITYPLKDAASAAKLGAALSALDKGAASALWNAQVGTSPAFDWTIRKDTAGKVKALRYTMTFRSAAGGAPKGGKGGGKGSAKGGARGGTREADGAAGPDMTKLFGKSLDAYVAVVGTRFVATVGSGAKARLAALASGKPPASAAAPPAPLTEALTATTGRDGFFYFDIGSVLSLVGNYAQDPRFALLARGAPLPIPLFGAAGGDGAGNAWTLELTFPASAFTGAGAVIQKLGASAALAK